MATGTNAIATEQEVCSITGKSTSYGNRCCTKSVAITLGADDSKLSVYSNNQLVKYSDIVKKVVTPTYYTHRFNVMFIFSNSKTIGKQPGASFYDGYRYVKGYLAMPSGYVDFDTSVNNFTNGTPIYSNSDKSIWAVSSNVNIGLDGLDKLYPDCGYVVSPEEYENTSVNGVFNRTYGTLQLMEKYDNNYGGFNDSIIRTFDPDQFIIYIKGSSYPNDSYFNYSWSGYDPLNIYIFENVLVKNLVLYGGNYY